MRANCLAAAFQTARRRAATVLGDGRDGRFITQSVCKWMDCNTFKHHYIGNKSKDFVAPLLLSPLHRCFFVMSLLSFHVCAASCIQTLKTTIISIHSDSLSYRTLSARMGKYWNIRINNHQLALSSQECCS